MTDADAQFAFSFLFHQGPQGKLEVPGLPGVHCETLSQQNITDKKAA